MKNALVTLLPYVLVATVLSSTPGPLAAGQAQAARMPVEDTAGWAILSEGRVKPLETHAREVVRAITGRSGLDGLSELEIFWGYNLAAAEFRTREYVRIDQRELKRELGFDPDKRRLAFDELMGNVRFQQLVEGALQRKAEGLELDSLAQEALAAYEKLELVAALTGGRALNIVPVLRAGGAWSTPDHLREATEPERAAVWGAFVEFAGAYRSGRAEAFSTSANQLTSALRAINPGVYPSVEDLDKELLYNSFNAFGKTWKLYLGAFFVTLFFGLGSAKKGRLFGLGILGAGLLFHTVGIGLRWQIAGRAPVSDMYESLVFMAWGVIAIGLALEFFQGKGYFSLCAGLMGFVALAFAEHLPIDSSINPLVPVLANTSWLSVHVMTIMLSYSAFALAMALGHLVLVMQLFRPGKSERLGMLAALLYRTLLVGVLFLAAGIAFGAIWANESWGRYWGWDPKETWSLITFFAYLGLVHARFAGWLHNFGLAVCSIACFLCVVMTYYGVNFILGAGLHSYGFASGGTIWAASFFVVESAILLAAWLRYRGAIAAQAAALRQEAALA